MMTEPALPIPIADYEAVRKAIDLTITAAMLPDSTIGLSIYVGEAEAWVASQDPDWATRTGAAASAIRRAAIYRAAGNLVPALPVLTREQMGDASFTYATRDIVATVADLYSKATSEIGLVIGAVVDPFDLDAMPTMFTLAPGYRGQ
jgi:hypothetical protein